MRWKGRNGISHTQAHALIQTGRIVQKEETGRAEAKQQIQMQRRQNQLKIYPAYNNIIEKHNNNNNIIKNGNTKQRQESAARLNSVSKNLGFLEMNAKIASQAVSYTLRPHIIRIFLLFNAARVRGKECQTIYRRRWTARGWAECLVERTKRTDSRGKSGSNVKRENEQ